MSVKKNRLKSFSTPILQAWGMITDCSCYLPQSCFHSSYFHPLWRSSCYLSLTCLMSWACWMSWESCFLIGIAVHRLNRIPLRQPTKRLQLGLLLMRECVFSSLTFFCGLIVIKTILKQKLEYLKNRIYFTDFKSWILKEIRKSFHLKIW